MKIHERFEDKKRLISSREMNRIKEHSYGKWYLRPEEFNKKVVKLNSQFTRLKKTLAIDS